MDGIDQHYPSLLYYGKLLRGLFKGNGFPMVDFSIGMGFDTLTTLNYYVIGDPISLLSIFMKARNAVHFYDFLIILRFYLAGLSYIALLIFKKKDGAGVILGALIYVYSGYSLYAGIRHPFFMNPMIYLPLIIIGVDLVLQKKKPYLMISMIFISTLSNFYFLYALTVITVIYIIFRYLLEYRKDYQNFLLGFLQTGLRTGGYYLLGIALAGIVLIPVLYAFSQNGRLDVSPKMVSGSYLYYNAKYYLTLFQGLYAPGIFPGYWTVLAFSAVAAVSVAIMLGNKEHRQLQLIYLLTLIGLSVPAFGYFMNGFSYTSNRWCFLISLLTAVTFSLTYDKIYLLGKKECIILFTEVIFYGILSFAFPARAFVKLIFGVLLTIMLCVFLLQTKWFRERRQISSMIIFILVISSLGLNGYGIYAKQFNNYANEFLTKKEIITRSTKGPLRLMKDIHDNSFYRIETYGDKALNEALILGFHDVSGYFSLMDGRITAYLKDLEVLNQRTAFRFHNLDNRTILDDLANVGYFVSDHKEAAPYGYELLKEGGTDNQKYYLFKNRYTLPLGYTYHDYILKKDYDALSALEKQNAMLKEVVLNDNTDYAQKAGTLKTDQTPSSGIEKLPVTMIPDANVTIGNNVIYSKKAGAAITLKFTAKPNTETYLRLGNFITKGRSDRITNIYVKGASGVLKKTDIRSPYYNSYFGKENYLFHLGYSSSGEREAVINFPDEASYSYDTIEVYSVDMSNYAEQIKALSNNALQNILVTNNKIQGDIRLDQKEVLVLSIPYSKGWHATVDGVKKELLPANVMYMALPLDAGSHHIILKYRTPYLGLGFLVTLTAGVILIGIVLYQKKRKRNYYDLSK
jgi:Bacterial membrane protein YfhO.